MMNDYFPFFKNNSSITYMDTAATSQCLYTVVEDQHDFNTNHKSNAHRSGHSMGTWVDQKYYQAKEKIGEFLSIDNPHERIIFNSGSSQGLSDAVDMIKSLYSQATIYVGIDSHHSLLLPLIKLANESDNYKIRYIGLTESKHLDLDNLEAELSKDTGPKIIAITAISNVLGMVNDLDRIKQLNQKHHAVSILDASQIVGKREVKLDGFDFVTFSWHKVYGPSGLGTLIIDKRWTSAPVMRPAGGTVTHVTLSEVGFVDNAARFEPGTQNLSAIVTIPRLAQWLIDNIKDVEQHDNSIATLTASHVSDTQFKKISNSESGLLSLVPLAGAAEDYAYMLDASNVMIRSGKLCAEPLVRELTDHTNLIRLSWGCYTSNNDIEITFDKLGQIYEKLRRNIR